MYRLLLVCCLVLSGYCGFTQSPPYLQYTTADGLPSNIVYTVYKDHFGFLWFGTDKGAARYNGLRFEHFTTADGLPDNEVFSFREDYDGRLWIGTYNGQLCYYKDGKFQTSKNTPFLHLPFKPFNTVGMNLEPDSSITIMFADRYNFVNITDNKLKAFMLADDKQESKLLCINKKNNNLYELVYDTYRRHIDSNSNTISTAPYTKNYQYKLFYGTTRDYFYANRKVYNTDETLLFPQTLSLPEKSLMTMSTFLLSIYWNGQESFFCTRNGLFGNHGIHLLKDKIVTCIGQDIDSNFWITTYKNGIYKLSKDFKSVALYQNMYKNRLLHATRHGNSLYYSTSDNNKLYQFNNGVNKTLLEDLSYQKYSIETERWAKFIIPDAKTAIFFTDDQNKMTIDVSKNNHHFVQHFDHFARSILDIFFDGTNIYCVDNHNIYKQNYFKILNRQSQSLNCIFESFAQKDRILARAMDKHGNLWISTSDAVYKFMDDKAVRQTDFKNLDLRKFTFLAGSLIGYDNRNVLYIATPKNGHYTLDTVETAGNNLWGEIYILDSTRALLGTNHYYQVLTLRPKNSHRPYSIMPVPQSFIPLNAEYVYADSSNCYFLKDGNITAIRLELLVGNAPPPVMVFTGFSTIRGDHALKSAMTVPQKEARDITIRFTGISFSNEDILSQYSSTTDPVLTDWHDITGNTISFPSLNYGHYFIKIRAKTSASDYSEVTGIELTILKPFWLSWWLLAMGTVVFVAGLIFIIKLIVRRILSKRKKEYDANMRFYGAEYKALNALMNPHFIFNSLNNIQGLINRDDKKEANKFLMHFSTLVRQNMQNVSKGTVTLQEELDLIKNYLVLEKMRFQDFVNYNIEIAAAVETEVIRIPPLLIQPLVENAIKHGLLPKPAPDGMVTINVYEQDEDVYIDVIDNGAGYRSSSKPGNNLGHESFGLANLGKRAAYAEILHKQSIRFTIRETKDEAGNITGTIATLKISAVMPT